MEIFFKKTEDAYIQSLKSTMNGPRKTIYPLLSTTEGISSWFPQLSFRDNELVFDLGNNEEEIMKVLETEQDKHISFTWDIGKVSITLNDSKGKTDIMIESELPFEFSHIIRDFTGWQYQIQNLNHVYETGEILPLDKFDFEKVESEIDSLLKEI